MEKQFTTDQPDRLQTADNKRKILHAYDSDQDEYGDDFADFCSLVHKVMKGVAPKTDKWFAYGLKLTWRNIAGHQFITADKAETIIRKILPDTSSFNIELLEMTTRGVMEFRIYHHDKPMGESIWVMTQSMEKKIDVMAQHFEKFSRPGK
jgi:hypothetical protein